MSRANGLTERHLIDINTQPQSVRLDKRALIASSFPIHQAAIVKLDAAQKQLSLFTCPEKLSSVLVDLKMLLRPYQHTKPSNKNKEKTDISSIIEHVRHSLTQLTVDGDNNITHNGLSLARAAYSTLIALAQYSPLNEVDPTTRTTIPKDKQVFISSGHQFDLAALSKWRNERPNRSNEDDQVGNCLLNPLTNAPFSPEDLAHIHAEAKRLNFFGVLGHVGQLQEMNDACHSFRL